MLARITAELKASSPAFVFVDSFRAMAREASTEGMGSFQQFVQQLAMQLTGSRATSFLMGEFAPGDAGGHRRIPGTTPSSRATPS